MMIFAPHSIIVRSLVLAAQAFIFSACTENGGNGGLLSLMLGADGFVYVSYATAIFKVAPQ